MASLTMSKRSDDFGFSLEEAKETKKCMDMAYAVGSPTSKWLPAEIVPEDEKGGYKVTIHTKEGVL